MKTFTTWFYTLIVLMIGFIGFYFLVKQLNFWLFLIGSFLSTILSVPAINYWSEYFKNKLK